MVSLRKNSSTPKSNANFLFSEGERVLCYEPDPNKAKVLYDSKILDIIARDGCTRSNKKTEYTVHFFGWNRTWDRIVTEESILKDTPSNRQLQRELAEQAAGRLKGKKLKLNKIPTIIKEVISSLNEQDQNAKDGYEQASNIDSDFNGEDSSSSNLYTTNSNGSISELETTNQNCATNSNTQIASSALTNQTTIKTINEANLFTIVNNQITNYINKPMNDNQNQELCQQIITNLDSQIKCLLEADQKIICDEQKLYSLPVKPEHSVHRILNEFEQFSLRMLDSSIQTNLKFKPDDQLINSSNNSAIDHQANHLNNTIHANNSINNLASNHQTITRTNRLNIQSTNQINQQTNQSNQINQTANNSNFISNNSNNSTGSSSSLNCLNAGKQSKDSTTPTNHSFTSQTIREFTNSIEIYFNTLTDKMYLFYSDKEGEQFQQLKQLDNYLKPIHTFGFIHLLRLIILLPDFLSFCSIPNKQLKQLIFLLQQFCDYLLDNQTKFTS